MGAHRRAGDPLARLHRGKVRARRDTQRGHHPHRVDTGGLARAPEVPAAVLAHERWIRGDIGDNEWLPVVRAMYRRGLTHPGGWNVAKHHSYFWSQLGETVDTIAYVNAARCQWPGAQPTDKVVKACLERLPLTPLIRLLRPRLVLSNSFPVFEQLTSVVPTLYIHQLNGRNLLAAMISTEAESVTVGIGRREPTVQALMAAGLSHDSARHRL